MSLYQPTRFELDDEPQPDEEVSVHMTDYNPDEDRSVVPSFIRNDHKPERPRYRQRVTPKRRKGISLDVILALGIAAFVWGWTIVYCVFGYKAQYTALATVLIKDSATTSHYVLPDQNYAAQTTTSSASNPVLNTMGLLKGHDISDALWERMHARHAKTLQKLGIKTKSQWDAYYGDGKRFIKAKNDPGTDLISIKFTWANPVLAAEGLDTVLQAFSDASLRLNQAEQKNRNTYLEQQVAVVSRQLDKLRHEKRDYKDKMGPLAADAKSGDLVQSQIDMANKLSEKMALANGKEAEFTRYERMLGMSPEKAISASAVGLNASISKLQDQYYKLSQDYAFAKATLTDKNPKVRELKAQMDTTQQNIADELRRTLGPKASANGSVVADATRGDIISKMAVAQAEMLQARGESSVLSQRLDDLNTQLDKRPAIEEDMSTIDDSEKSLGNALYTLRQKQLEAQMKQAETLSNVFIVDAPRKPRQESFPNREQSAVLGLILGLVAGISAIFFKRSQAIPALAASFGVTVPNDRADFEKALQSKMSRMDADDPEVRQALDNLFAEQAEQSLPSRLEAERSRMLKQRLYQALIVDQPHEHGLVHRTMKTDVMDTVQPLQAAV